MTGGVSRSQPRRQQASGVALEDQHGVIHMLAVGAVEEAELLLAVGRVFFLDFPLYRTYQELAFLGQN